LHRAISINTLSLAPAPLGEQVDTIARLGAAAISPDLGQLREGGLSRSIRLLRDSGLRWRRSPTAHSASPRRAKLLPGANG